MVLDGETHRPGPLKQTNKAHKHGRHRSKGSISVDAKGKVSIKALSKRNKSNLNRTERRNQSSQIRRNKRDEVTAKKRSLGRLESAPFLVCILPLHKYIDGNKILQLLKKCDPQTTSQQSSTGITHLYVPKLKQRYSFVLPNTDSDLHILDTLKVSDTVLLVVSAEAGIGFGDALIDEWGQNIFESANLQGLPTPIVTLQDLDTVPKKNQNIHKQNIKKIVSKLLPNEKFMTVDSDSDGLNLLRMIANQKRKEIIARDQRPYMYPEKVEFEDVGEGVGTLKLTGYLRGKPLSVNGLIHIPGLGDFQMSQIDAPFDPLTINKKNNKNADDSESETIRVLKLADPSKQESLQSEAAVDPMDAEQTWPTTEELNEAEKEQKTKKAKKIPKGWSDYQSAWIPDEDAEFYSESEEGDSNDEYQDARSQAESDDSDQEYLEDGIESEVAADDRQYDEHTDFYQEKEDLDRIKAAKDDFAFPDEVDTPQDMLVKERFQKYRGLESFKTSSWDPKENLPSEYGRIFRFVNFNRTRKQVLKQLEDVDDALAGWYIRVHVKGVSQTLWSNFRESGAPLIFIGLFPNEHKMSVVNVRLQRTHNYNEPIKSKERLIFQCGYRKFITNPIFSEHTTGNKHKMERFFQSKSVVVATFYAPIQFPPAPVLCFKEVNGKMILVATGTLLSSNPDRIIVKRIVLSGHPFKVHKRSSVVRFMFFNREDIEYFKPCKLRTKLGLVGNIKEPLGTHGHMKCIFNGQLKSHDTVVLNLYKRIFPKWTYEEYIPWCGTNTMES